jgi:hypothetical protein
LRFLRHFRNEVSDHHSQVIDVKNSIHVRILQVECALHFMDPIGQFQEFGESQLRNVVQTLRPVPLKDVPIPFARVTFPAGADTVIGRVKESNNPGIDTRSLDWNDMVGAQTAGGSAVHAEPPLL